MTQDDAPYADSINISPADVGELSWEHTIMHMVNKSPDGEVMAPLTVYDQLVNGHLKYVCLGFIHDN